MTASRSGARPSSRWEADERPKAEPARARSWQERYAQVRAQLERQTGEPLAAWNAKVKAFGPTDEPALRSSLAGQSATGYPAMLFVFETFGYPWYLHGLGRAYAANVW